MAEPAPPLGADQPDPAAVGVVVSAGVVAFLRLGPVIRRDEAEGASSDYRDTSFWDVTAGRLVSYCLGAGVLAPTTTTTTTRRGQAAATTTRRRDRANAHACNCHIRLGLLSRSPPLYLNLALQ